MTKRDIFKILLAGAIGLGATGTAEQSLSDHRAKVFHVEGEGSILKSGATEWLPVQNGDWIEEGDEILTKAGAVVQIHFDDYYLNFARIDANTLAKFRAIEPTDILLSDGSIFNQLEGLKDANYTVATPSSIVGVRGTKFMRTFTASTGEDITEVAEGAVDASLLGAVSEQVMIAANSFLQFDKSMLESGRNFSDFPVLPLDPLRLEYLNKLSRDSQEALIRFSGREAYDRAQEEWKRAGDKTAAAVSIRDKGMDLSQRPVLTPGTIFRSGKEEKTEENEEDV